MYETHPTPTRAPQRCLIVGCGGHGRVVLDILLRAGRYEPFGFLDSNPDVLGRRVDGIPVIGTIDDIARLRREYHTDHAIVAIGDNGVRRHFADRLDAGGVELVNAIHPSANIAPSATLGRNVVIAAGALVSAHCQIGDSVILNTGCIVDHESMIGTATHVCPGARLAGRVTVESGAFVGIGATVIQSVRIGCEATIGAGAVVIADVAAMTTVVGVPARPVKHVAATTFTRPNQRIVHPQLETLATADAAARP
ncbi:MAG: acetyltransferase [Phycisphaerae bacterium]